MCGIAGIMAEDVTEKDVDLMLSMIAHRGPDEYGTYSRPGLALGAARLSIVDIAGGQQPMMHDATGVAMVFNGEVFNYVELREEMRKAGQAFRTDSDTEVILNLYLQHGEGFLQFLNGQFAIAIWDPRVEKLLLARDRFGICPLYYCLPETGGTRSLIFGSEIKSLFTSSRVAKQLSPKALDQTFTFWSTVGNRSAFEGVSELEPGTYMRFSKKNGPEFFRYWSWPFPQLQETREVDFEVGKELLIEALTKAVSIRLRADTEVGSYLSGGIDSSALIEAATRVKGKGIKAFSVGFEDASYDESRYQHLVAEFLETEHHHVRCDFADIDTAFEKVVCHAESPLFRSAPVPMHLLSSAVKSNGIKVVLTGEGADEVLLGYDLFREVKIRRFWQKDPESRMRPLLFKKLYAYLPQFANPRFANLSIQSLKGTLDSDSPFYSHSIRWANNSANKVYFSHDTADQLRSYSAIDELQADLPEEFMAVDDLDRAQFLEVRTLLRGYLLSSQGDRMAMSNSVEGRVPFLDHEFVAFASSLPRRFKLPGLKDKHILRKAMEGRLPPEICDRPKFAYQAPEVRAFFRPDKTKSPLIDKYLSPQAIRRVGLFDAGLVAQLLRKIEVSELGRLGTRDNMAFIQILSTHILQQEFVEPDIRQIAQDRICDMHVKTRLYGARNAANGYG